MLYDTRVYNIICYNFRFT